MKNLKYFAIVLILVLNISKTVAQGCSDAGFCTLNNSFKHEETKKNNLEIGTVFAGAEEDVNVYSQYVTYTRDFSASFSMNLKITTSTANGSFGTRGNIGDAFLTGNYKFKSESEHKKWSVLFGIKAPFTAGNDKINNFALPMVYQSSLGTFDIVTGVNLTYNKWDFNAALQIPLTDSKNSYLSDFSSTTLFQSTNLFKRKSDGLLRSTYTIKSDNFTFRPNLLLIYHFGNDSFENIFGKRQEIIGSQGFTLNGNMIINYKINESSSLETSLATPFVVRDAKPDGLTRKYVIGISYKVNF